MTSDDFDDFDELAELEAEGWVIQHEVQNVAIFPTTDGDVIVKEIVHTFPSPCITTIVIGRNNVPAAIAAMKRAGGLLDADEQGGASDKPEPLSGAERSRRYRQRKRHAECDASGDTPLPLSAAE